MTRLLIGFTFLILIAIISIGGCDGGGSGSGMGPEPTPVPGFSCDFVPDESGQFYTEGDCIELSKAFDCADFNFQDGICEVTGCEDCLCDAGSLTFNNVDNDFECGIAKADGGCFNSFFNEGSNQCVLLVCLGHNNCGPIP